MQVELKANGKTVQVEMTKEQLKRLGLIEEQRTGYERVKKGDVYYFNITRSETVAEVECNRRIDEGRYDTGNYYTDEKIAKNNARADKLSCQLRQWQDLNDEPVLKEFWKNEEERVYYIAYSFEEDLNGREKGLIVCTAWQQRIPNVIYFTSRKKAEEAIKAFKDELKWYHTEYQQRLDEE